MTDTVPRPDLTMDLVADGPLATIRLAGEIDLAAAPDLTAFGVLAASSAVVESIVIDMSDVSFIDCAGVGALVSVLHAARERSIDLRLHGIGPAVGRMLDLTGLKAMFGLPDLDGSHR